MAANHPQREKRPGIGTDANRIESNAWKAKKCRWCGHHAEVHDPKGCILCDEQQDTEFRVRCLFVNIEGRLLPDSG